MPRRLRIAALTLLAWGLLGPTGIPAEEPPGRPVSEAERRGWEPPPEGVDAHTIAARAEAQLRADSTFMRAEMTVVSPAMVMAPAATPPSLP